MDRTGSVAHCLPRSSNAARAVVKAMASQGRPAALSSWTATDASRDSRDSAGFGLD